MKKTNKGLVKFAKKQIGRPYWYGCFGQISSRSLYESKKKQYPAQYRWPCKDNQTGVCPAKQIGVKVFDCIGLIKSYLWTKNGKIDYNPEQDVSANGMLILCKNKGKIDTIPDIPGILVFMEGHVGVYIGSGYVIEARGHEYGVVKTKLKARKWTNWGYCPYITYIDNKKPKKDKIKNDFEYFKKYDGKSKSIVDALKSLNYKSDFSYREKIAKVNGISNYYGKPKQNIKMLKLLKKGKLIKPKG